MQIQRKTMSIDKIWQAIYQPCLKLDGDDENPQANVLKYA